MRSIIDSNILKAELFECQFPDEANLVAGDADLKVL
jgi:hypothetical protein